MKWKGVSNYSIRSGSYRIAKTLHSGEPLYTLYRDSDKLGSYDDADKARDAAVRDKQRRAKAQGD